MTKGELIRKAKDCLSEYINCWGICNLLADQCGMLTTCMHIIFPELHDKELIRKFKGDPERAFYWGRLSWNTGRLDFFNMLYEKYKDDNTEI